MKAIVKVLGGLEVTVKFTNCVAEDWEIVAIAGRPLRKNESVKWLYERLTESDKAVIIESCNEVMQDMIEEYRSEAI